jgi:hypothetical protein
VPGETDLQDAANDPTAIAGPHADRYSSILAARAAVGIEAMGDVGLKPTTSALSRWNRVGRRGSPGVADGSSDVFAESSP